MRKTGIGLFTNRAFESINIHTEYLKKCDNKPGIMTVTVQHAHISAASATIYVMNAGISQNKIESYTSSVIFLNSVFSLAKFTLDINTFCCIIAMVPKVFLKFI